MRPEILRQEGTYSVSPLTCDLTEPEPYKIEEVPPPTQVYRTTPWLVLDIEEETSSGSMEEHESLRLVIDRVEAIPAGYIVHHNLRKTLPVAAVAESSSADDKTMSVLAGCGVIFGILLLAVLVTISPMVTGTGPAAGFSAIGGASGVVAAPGHPADTPQPSGDGAVAGTPGGIVMAPGVPAAAGPLVIPAETTTPPPTPQLPVIPKSYVTLQPVAALPSPPQRDLGTNLPVPVAGDYFTIYSLDGQQAGQNIPYVVYELRNPPLVIDYTVTPLTITDVKAHDYKIMSTRHHDNISVSRPYEESWFHVVVRDNGTQGVLQDGGFGKTFAREPSGQVVVYKSGTYRFEFSGGFAVVNLTMKVKKEGNIP